MKKSKLLRLSALALAGVVTFAGCGGASQSSKRVDAGNVQFETAIKNEGKAVSNADPITIGIENNQPLLGQLNPVFSTKLVETLPMQYTMRIAIPSDDKLAIKQDDDTALLNIHIDKENKKIRFKIHKDGKWSNGEDFVAEDIIATYHLMGNPKFEKNERYDESYEAITGMKDYHEGKADSISGIKKIDNKTVEISLDKVTPAMLFGSAIIPEYLNAGQIAKITDFSKFWEAELNTQPLSYGPYYLEKNNGGESMLFAANPYYFKGEPKNKKLKFVVVPTAQVVEKLKSGEIDFMSVLTAKYPEVKDLNNGKLVGKDALSLSYLGFKLGKYDQEKGQNVMDPNAKVADVNLRRAIAMSIDLPKLHKSAFNNIPTVPTGSGIYPKAVVAAYNENGKSIPYDVEGAKKLLEENGYKDVDGDGFRENKDGSKLELGLAVAQAGVNETVANHFIACFKEVGLNVKLVDGKLLSGNDFWDKVENDDPSVDMFTAGWSLGTDPDPSNFVSTKSPMNLYRYTSEKVDALIEKSHSAEAFDLKKLKEIYGEIDELIASDLPWVPTIWTKSLAFVSNRLASFDISDTAEVSIADQLANVDILSEKAIPAK